ncbi:MAG: T9SS type A sorting domain-containing protein [Flavobacteriales bacterium]|nr:T9SS type A sorting domain-containing protein [Flavobacteriales bacterium]
MLKKISGMIVTLLIALCANAQTLSSSVVSTGGASTASSAGYLTYTIGETVPTTFTSGTSLLTSGFQQGHTSSDPLEIVELSRQVQIKLFPNPAKSFIEINVESADYKFFNITIFNSLGEKILCLNDTEPSGLDQNTRIDLEGFESGLYFANVTFKNNLTENGQTTTRKFFIRP